LADYKLLSISRDVNSIDRNLFTSQKYVMTILQIIFVQSIVMPKMALNIKMLSCFKTMSHNTMTLRDSPYTMQFIAKFH